MVKLVLMGNLDISNDMILLALYTSDINLLEVISNHLNTNRKYYSRFYLRFQELNFIVGNDLIEIENFKYFVDPETICCVFNALLENSEELNYLKSLEKILNLKIVTQQHLIYAFFKIAFKSGNFEALNVISQFSSKKMLKYAISDNDSHMLNIILSSLARKLPTNTISAYIDNINKNGLKKKCILALDKFVIRKKPIRI
jgi:hypothetical protein